ncbi:hypothetical protein GQ53DRAFT_659851 [Thozetella sp. PMI_491]|nr:hypothetical protein GQ53DRAFT_659851 [Thozetella sp. PMI_491]
MFATPAAKPAGSQEQAHPIGPFYESILNGSLSPKENPEAPPVTSAKAPEPAEPAAPAAPAPAKRGRKPKAAASPADDKAKSVSPSESPSSSSAPPDDASNDLQARARLIFGNRLAGPAERAERLAAIRNRSSMVAGVLVPPKPVEPDNCCMSGCVNCVWDRYRDELEDWAAANAEAERRVAAQTAGVGTTEESMAAGGEVRLGSHELDEQGAVSMDDDGGGSASNWDRDASGKKIAKDFWDDDLYRNLPVGIREFMKQEKRLKQKHARERTSGG